MTLTYTDLETAKATPGTRLVVTSLVPSPWSEAAKGCFRVAGVPVSVVRRARDNAALVDAWTGVDNVPVVLHEREPIRSNWAAIVALADRLGREHGAARLLPDAPAARADAMGTLHEIAGEEGIGWNSRIAMLHAGFTSDGTKGFPLPVAKFLAARYAYRPEAVARAHERITAQLAFLADKLQAAGGTYFGGATPNAVDVYAATFLTPLAGTISEAECPQLVPPLRVAFASAHEAFGALVPPALVDHRRRMFGTHLPLPIEL